MTPEEVEQWAATAYADERLDEIHEQIVNAVLGAAEDEKQATWRWVFLAVDQPPLDELAKAAAELNQWGWIRVELSVLEPTYPDLPTETDPDALHREIKDYLERETGDEQ